jgi:polysaccharide biosynthesis/export protein
MMNIFQFRKISTFLFLLFITSLNAFAQPGNVPFSTNPFGTNPIKNPFGGDDKKTIEKKIEQKKEEIKKTTENQQDLLNSEKEKKAEEGNKNFDNVNTDNEDETGVKTYSKKTFDKKDTIKEEDKTYGMDYFENSGFNTSDKTVVTPPQDYRLGVGDEIIVNIYGQSEAQLSYTIGRDGSIYPRYAGKIYLQGLTFGAAQTLIQSKFRNVVSGSNVDVQIGKIRTIKITIVGEVKRNGSVSVSAFTTAINAISNAGGITKLGNLRKIEIRRNGSVVHTIDLYEFIQNGGNIEDQYLEDGDVINVGTYDKLVKADGSFKRPMYYQLKENENLNNLIELAGGPAFDARFSSVQIKSVINEQPRILTVNLREINNKNDTYALFDGDIVMIKKVNPNFANTIEIEGAVNYPDVYQIANNDRLITVIERAGGLLSDALKSRAFVYRGDTNFATEVAKIDLTNLEKNDFKNNIEILPGDRIVVISKKDFINTFNVEIAGSVRKPITIPYSKNLNLKDLLIAAGGLTIEAENGRIEIASIVDSADNYKVNVKKEVIWKTININPNLELDVNSENIILNPFDKVYVRTKSDFKLLEKVTITGEINFGGEYPILNGNEKIASLIMRAGNLKESAFLEGAIFTRKGAGVIAINLKNVINDKSEKYNIILKDGDLIYIPKKNELVSIKGQVLAPSNIFGELGAVNVKQYINAAGGFSEDPWKDRISVTYPNGKIKTTKRIFFIRKYPKVVQGCIVNVPRKPAPKENQFSWKDASTFTSSVLGTMATLVSTYALLVSTGIIKLKP